MDIWQLSIFCKVVELKSFSNAAKAVCLSQPTVSSHIKDLEEHFSCRLIDRLSKEAVPTQAGKLLYGYACRIIALKKQTETALSEFHGTIKGHLTIGGSTIPGVYVLPRLMGAFKTSYPDVTLSIQIADTESIIHEILAGNLDFGIVGARTGNKSIHQELLIEDEMQLIVPSDHKWAGKKSIALKHIFKEPFIVRERGSGTLASLQFSLSHIGYGIDHFNISAELGSTEAIRQGIKNHLGLSILSSLAVAEDLQTGSLNAVSISDLNLKQFFYITRHKHRSLPPLCETFIDFICHQINP
ncbi:MAG: selenium metabolism-associated LysR family transcriptional regulator [Desulfobacterales bacterium]|nr:selenium metabolism-associated LysR family transcriptional regulator [Desulfobacterales bacterium]MDD4070937.1 selenium metabolism-associated LysR family transcriptional regulator [Desulfobacterales bacterium]MDD4393437.1 selenium metabolism-associated LysR family transcriptional regulator [Desulfobacterales bacterium]